MKPQATKLETKADNFIPDEYKRQQGIAMVNAIFNGYGSSEKPMQHPSDPTGRLATESTAPPKPAEDCIGIKMDSAPDPEYVAIFFALTLAGLLLFLSKVSFETVKNLFMAFVLLSLSVLVIGFVWMIATALNDYHKLKQTEEIFIPPMGPGAAPLPTSGRKKFYVMS